MNELVRKTGDMENKRPKIKKEDFPEHFLEFMEKGWAIDSAYNRLDENASPNEESVPWNIIREYFKTKLEEMINKLEE